MVDRISHNEDRWNCALKTHIKHPYSMNKQKQCNGSKFPRDVDKFPSR